ncbi:MAG: hypothetical protein GX647_10275 [Clostridiales bacterium]|jgi:flavodoxin|nr:hypothetical protein [Clostridiales bacterium]
MKRIRIVFATRTGHSKKLAEAIGRALNIRAESVASKPDIKDVDLLFIVGGIYGGNSMPELLSLVDRLGGGVGSVALVTSCASKKQRQEAVRKRLEQKGIPVVDEMVCRGSFLFLGIGHPNDADLAEAERFAVRLAEAD